MNDSQTMRTLAGNNQWPKTLLEKYHPRKDYNGDELNAITPVILGAFGFFLDPALRADNNEVTLDNSLLQLVGSPIEVLPMTLADECVKLVFGYSLGGYNDQPMDRVQLLDFRTGLMNLINEKTKEVVLKKSQLKIPRPSTYEGQFDGPTTNDGVSRVSYSTPCLGATVLAATGKYVEYYFKFSDKDLKMWFDTLYVSAMLWPMSGVNSIEAVIHSFEEEGYNMTKII